MNALTLSHRLRAGILSVAFGAAALGIASPAFAGEETTWYDKWPEIQAQLNSQAAGPPALGSRASHLAEYPAPVRTKEGFLMQDPYPPILNRNVRPVDPQIASPYDEPWFNRDPG